MGSRFTIEGCLAERRCWAVPLGIWALLVLASLAWDFHSLNRHALEMAAERGRNIFQMVQLTRLWNARHGGVYVPVSPIAEPNPHLEVPDRDIVDERGRHLTKINPAYMTRQISELAGEDGLTFHITSLKPIRPKNAPDAWERRALEAFEAGARTRVELLDGEAGGLFRYMEPLEVKRACLNCHEKQGYKLGDIRGGISVSLPAAPIFAAMHRQQINVVALHFAVWLLVSGLMLAFLARQRHQWLLLQRIRDRQEEVIERRTEELRRLNRQLTEEVGERERAQRLAEEEREFLQTVIDGVAEPVMMIRGDYQVELMNREARKYLPDGVIPPDWRFCYQISHNQERPCSGDQHPCPLALARDGGRAATAVHEHIMANGESRFVELLASPLWNPDGTFRGIIESGRDITERMRVEGELRDARDAAEAANRAKSSFLATMSHEIRTPLNAIIGMAELLADGELDEEQRRYVKVFHEAGDSLMELINDVLDLSKIEAGQITINPAPFTLEELLGQVRGVMHARAEEKGLELALSIHDELPPRLLADALLLRQVLLNLVGNAIKFTHRGRITIAVEAEPGAERMLRFSVSDTGIGVPREKREEIFERFTQADDSITRHYGGTGLGLAICRRVVEQWGGAIWLDEGGAGEEGVGSRFLFTLPYERTTAVVPVGEATLRPVARGAAGRPLKMLLVDDAEDNLFLVKAYLKGTPYRLVTARYGEEAVARFKQEGDFDLVLMDLQMPGMDGYTATGLIRDWEHEQGRAPAVVLALTAHAYQEDVEHSIAAGCDDHLSKPIKKGRLLEVLADFAARR